MRYLIPLALLLLVEPAVAQSLPATAARIAAPERDATTYTANARVNDRTGFPVTVYHSPYRAEPAAPAQMAWSYIQDSAATLGIDDLAQLAHVNTRETRSGYRVQFDQMVSGIPVYEAGIVVSLGEDGRIHFVSNGYQPGIRVLSLASKTGSVGARSIAQAWIKSEGPPVAQAEETVIFSRAGKSRLAHRVQMVTGQGSWEFLVDASSGELILAKPRGHADTPRSGAGPTGSFGTWQLLREGQEWRSGCA